MQSFLRRLSLITVAMLALATPLLAQGGGTSDDDYDFSEIPVEEEEIPYIGVGGGYQLVMTLIDLAELNTLAGSHGIPEFTGGLFMHGGGGWTAIGIVPNLRLGVFGGGGSKESSTTIDSGGARYTRSLQYASGYTSALLDYAISPFSRFTIAPGVMIGGGRTTVELTQTAQGITYGGLFDPGVTGGAAGLNRQASMTRTFISIVPMLNFEYALTQFILLRAGGSYARSVSGSWSDRHGTTIEGVPEGLHADGLSFQVGLFLGLFQQ